MDMDIDETAKDTPPQKRRVLQFSVIVAFGDHKTCRSNIGGCAWKRQVYLLRTYHALHSPLGSRLPGYYQNW
ncbi:hypothetical protein ACFX15_009555 [Malus domestica]